MSEQARKQKLPYLPVTTLERVHDGDQMYFTGMLTNEVMIFLEKREGVSRSGRERWLLTLARKPQGTPRTPRTPGQAP